MSDNQRRLRQGSNAGASTSRQVVEHRPYPCTSTAVDHVLSLPGLSDADKAAILGGTASGLLGIKA